MCAVIAVSFGVPLGAGWHLRPPRPGDHNAYALIEGTATEPGRSVFGRLSTAIGREATSAYPQVSAPLRVTLGASILLGSRNTRQHESLHVSLSILRFLDRIDVAEPFSREARLKR